MYKFERIDLGEYRADTYLFCGFVRPEPTGSGYDPNTDADNWGVSVAQKQVTNSNVEVVRLDNAHGQDPHIDKEYLPSDTDEAQKRQLSGSWPYSRMRQFLLTKWTDYADLHIYYNE